MPTPGWPSAGTAVTTFLAGSDGAMAGHVRYPPLVCARLTADLNSVMAKPAHTFQIGQEVYLHSGGLAGGTRSARIPLSAYSGSPAARSGIALRALRANRLWMKVISSLL